MQASVHTTVSALTSFGSYIRRTTTISRTVHADEIVSENSSLHSTDPVSVTKFIRIGIADKNDNPPYFDKALYEAEVDENEDIQHTVLTVTAKDHDECKY
uniref:Cadherin domain-containing protein n=1 Tax=Anopheles quadriannulatus TaxID=34691 RepID=A0A182XN64_ANOQN